MGNTRRIGELGERIAESFLLLKGYTVLCRNYRYAGREIDLLVRKHRYLVAVEVKLRRSRQFGEAVEAVDRRKLARIHTALESALSHVGGSLNPRVDVIVIDFSEPGQMTVRHLEAVS